MAYEDQTGVNYKSICCEQIPELFLDKLVAKKHFSKFGKINRFILRPKRFSCTVEYETEAEAEKAVEEAGVFNGQEFPVHFAEKEVGHVQNTEEWVDADVQSELDAMGAGQTQLRLITTNLVNKLLSAPVKRNSPQRTAPKPVEPVQVTASKIDTTLRSELENLLRQPAYSAEERYRVLDARDKLIRLTSVKQTDFAKAEKRKGICPDMCPEKERLMRDFQRQVAVFEMNKSSMIGSISHRLAIKEYSRSSADQEVPLSHELRPANVLKMTMLYLMSRVMDQLDTMQVNVSDWFHFVWDRTRSIRKDITQQELCSLDAVELVEQCARFHIHCAARLVAEDPSVFDKKINAENLTKCLQTLKYLYHDLRLKNIPCPREAEFRSYIVLLNLGNSNFLWEVKQLPEHIQQSAEIKRAMTFYNVLQNNNYVRFFNMVREKETSYLSACILLGYFTRLRLRALEVIVKSHNWRKNSVFIPLEYLTKILGFEDEQSAVQFFQFHGLMCDDERGVMLDKPQPAVDYCMERALMLVESKRLVSVGECICGHPLDSPEIFENHQPHNSFDDTGILKTEAWAAEDQLRGDAAIAKTKEKPAEQQTYSLPAAKMDNLFKVPQITLHASPKQQLQPPLPPQPTSKIPLTEISLFSKTKAKDPPLISNATSNSIFGTMPTSTVNSGGNLFSASTSMKSGFGNIGNNIFGSEVKPSTVENKNLVKKTTEMQPSEASHNSNSFKYFSSPQKFTTVHSFQKDNISKEKQQSEAAAEAKRLEILESQRRQLEQMHKEKLEEAERLRKMATAAEERAAAERKRKKITEIESNAVKQVDALISTTILDEISTIARNELHLRQTFEANTKHLAEKLIEEHIADVVSEIVTMEYSIHCHDRMLLERYFNKWLNTTRKKIYQRKLLDTTPIWVTTYTREETAQQLIHPSLMNNLHMIKRYRHGQPCDFHKLLWDEESDLSCRSSVDICEMISKYLQMKMPINHIKRSTYFKLLFTFPGETDEILGFEGLCSKWLQHLLRFPKDNDDSQAYICTAKNNVALCVRKVCGTQSINESGKRAQHPECDNANGIICFMTCADFASTRRRLHNLMRQQSKHFRPIPVVFVIYDNSDFDRDFFIKVLDLNSLLERQLIGSYKFFCCSSYKADHAFKVNLEHALLYIIRSSLSEHNDRELIMERTQDWFETCLGEEMWHRWKVSEQYNPPFRKVCTFVEHVIGLYNAAIEHLCALLSENVENEPEFPAELKQFVSKPIETNNMPLNLEHFPADWKSPSRQRKWLEFMARIRLPSIEKPPPMQSLNDLKMWLLDYAGRCIPDDEKSTAAAYYAIKSLIEQINADDMQSLEIPERIKIVSFLPVMKPIIFAHINEQLQNSKLPEEIIYFKEKLRFYLEQPWWLTLEAVKSVTVDYSSKRICTEESFTKIKDPFAEIEAVLKRAAEISHTYEEKIEKRKRNSNDSVVNSLLQELDHTMQEIDAANLPGANDLAVPISKRKYTNSMKEKENKEQFDTTKEPNRKRKQTGGHSSSEVNDVIAHALSVIEKANATQEANQIFNYKISKLDL